MVVWYFEEDDVISALINLNFIVSCNNFIPQMIQTLRVTFVPLSGVNSPLIRLCLHDDWSETKVERGDIIHVVNLSATAYCV